MHMQKRLELMHKLRKLFQVLILLVRKIYAKIEAIKSEQVITVSIQWNSR